MFSSKFIKVAAAALSFVACSANATLITQTQVLDEAGKDMLFNFTGLTSPATSDGLITIMPLQGAGTLGLDLSGSFQNESENFEVTTDGITQGFYSCNGPSNVGATPIPGATDNSENFNDCEFTLEININMMDLNTYIADTVLSIGVLFGDDVSFVSDQDIVQVSLAFNTDPVNNVSAPAIGALSGLALVAFAAVRRKR